MRIDRNKKKLFKNSVKRSVRGAYVSPSYQAHDDLNTALITIVALQAIQIICFISFHFWVKSNM